MTASGRVRPRNHQDPDGCHRGLPRDHAGSSRRGDRREEQRPRPLPGVAENSPDPDDSHLRQDDSRPRQAYSHPRQDDSHLHPAGVERLARRGHAAARPERQDGRQGPHYAEAVHAFLFLRRPRKSARSTLLPERATTPSNAVPISRRRYLTCTTLSPPLLLSVSTSLSRIVVTFRKRENTPTSCGVGNRNVDRPPGIRAGRPLT